MKATFIFLFILVAVHFSPGCKKSSPPVKTGHDTLKLSRNALAYVSVPVGKYRIFKDSATGSLDSVVVVRKEITLPYHCCDVYGYNTRVDPYFEERLDITWEKRNPPVGEWLKAHSTSFWISSGDISNATLSLYGLQYGTIFYMKHVDRPLPTMTVDGRIYNNVLVASNTVSAGSIGNVYVSLYFWAKDIGLVQKSIVDASGIRTSYLVRYN